MNVKVYASGVLAYDSQLPEEKGYSMLSIRIKEGLNKGGSATLVLPSGHKLYDGFPAMVTPVEIYRDGKLRWRGRPLPHSGDFYNRRTITCEGELCFLNDATMRPYNLSGSPAELFTKLIHVYNEAVDEWKQFAVGEITVTSDTPVELSYSAPEQIYAAVQKLRNKCGGYILFDSAEDGTRRINWYSLLPYSCNQGIQLGSNLLDYSSSASVSGFATRIIPFGAADKNGNRIQIDVDGKDYVDNLEAQSVRGIIEKSVIFEGVTDPAQLKILAENDLQSAANIPETIQLSALDLSRFDMSLDSFAMGQVVSAASDVHDLTGQYALVSLDEDLVQPGVGSVILTRDARYYDSADATLTGSISSDQKKQETVRLSAIASAVANATNWITNGKGYMVAIRDATGNWTELCSLDDPDIKKAVNVWRWNNGGLGHSSNGYNGPYALALTQDGHIVADFITVGTLDAAIVTIKNLVATNIVTGILQSKDGKTFVLDLDNNTLKAMFTELSISGKTVDEIAQEKADAAEENAVGQAVDLANAAESNAKTAASEALSDYAETVTKDLESLQAQIDGNITTWFGSYVPTASNSPASGWTTTEQRNQHLGDLYYIVDNANQGGLVYRWAQINGSYAWQLVEDTEVAKALAAASKAQDTADGKRRTFVAQPVPPYDVGDLWVQGSDGDIMRCIKARSSGSYVASDWDLASKYIDEATAGSIAQGKVDAQTQADVFNKLTNNGAVKGLFIKDDQLYINASYIATGTLSSTDGSLTLNLETGELTVRSGTGDSATYLTFDGTGLSGYKGGTTTSDLIFRLWMSSLGPTLTSGPKATQMTVAASNGTSQFGNASTDTLILGKTVAIKPGKTLLWSGTCAQGDVITVPNTADYDLFAIRLGTEDAIYNQTILAYKSSGSSQISGVGGWAGTETAYKSLDFVTFTFEDDTWTLRDSGFHYVYSEGGTSAGTRSVVKEIRGII